MNGYKDRFQNVMKFLFFVLSPEDTSEGPENRKSKGPFTTENHRLNCASALAGVIKAFFWIIVSILMSFGIASLSCC